MSKKEKLSTILLSISLLCIVGCGNRSRGKLSLPNPPSNIKYEAVQLIDGPLSEYVEVVPGMYDFEIEKDENDFMSNYKGQLKVKFKFLKSLDVRQGTAYNHYGPSLLGKALDEKGAPLNFKLDLTSDKDLASYLNRGSGEEWLTVRMYGQGLIDSEEDAEKIIQEVSKGKKIRFNSEIVEEKKGSETTNSATDDDESTEDTETESNEDKGTTADGDCEEFLKGYEKFMISYIDIIKKMKDNPADQSVISSYATLVNEATIWAQKSTKCASDARFTARFTEIQMKIANAATGLR